MASADEDDEEVGLPALPHGTKNYMTPQCYRRMLDEREHLVRVERPEMANVVAWAASNGDRSENGDYLYGKRRLREIDRRIRFLSKRIDMAEVVDPATRPATDQVFLVPLSPTKTNKVKNTRFVSLGSMKPMQASGT